MSVKKINLNELKSLVKQVIKEEEATLEKKSPKQIEWEDLGNIIQTDILTYAYFNSPYIKREYDNFWQFDEYIKDVKQMPEFQIEYKPVDMLHKQMKTNGRFATEKDTKDLVKILKTKEDLDPIITDGDKPLNGVKRLQAYQQLGKKYIPTINIASFLKKDWNKWLDNDEKSFYF